MPTFLTQDLFNELQAMRDAIVHKPASPARVTAIIGDLLGLYWDKQLTPEAINAQMKLWFDAIFPHSAATIDKVANHWAKHSKRAPTPADFLELCNIEDETPERIARLDQLLKLPIRRHTDIGLPKVTEGKMIGCPIELGRMIKFARDNNHPFSNHEQVELYLAQGIKPDWWRPFSPSDPSRKEILDTMTPEQKLAATAK